MVQLVEERDGAPICPHCETTLRAIHFKSLSTRLGRRYVYYCGQCKKVLGVSHRKGFWMG